VSIASKHPDYLEVSDDYRQMRDTFAGQRKVKQASTLYLPPTAAHIQDGALKSFTSDGWLAYEAYRARAVFPEFVGEAVSTLVGVMHHEPAVIELPPQLEPLRNRATRKGESLQMLLRRINEQQLLFGRIGLLADFPQDPAAAERAEVPHFVTYEAETIINWDDERFTEFGMSRLNFVVLNEIAFVRGPEGANIYDFEPERRFRVLFLEPENPEAEESPTNPLVYKTFVEVDDIRSPTMVPMFRGATAEDIPFTFIGANDLNPKPDEIPLLRLSNLSLAIYRGEADYRQALHLQGQDTLVITGEEITREGDAKGEEEETRVGAGAVIRIAAGEGAGAEYIGVQSDGIEEQRLAIESDKKRAQSMGARLLEPRGTQAESGEALRIRVAASTATLSTIALTGAAGLESALKQAALWVGADPDQVKVRPNMDFTQDTPSPELARQLGEALKTGEIPLSRKAIHRWLQERNFTKFTFEEEQQLIEAESASRAARDQAETFVGRTEEIDGHRHSYVLRRFPDGSVHGTTDVVNGHFHEITREGETEISNKHLHGLETPEPQQVQPAEDEPGGPMGEEP